ncbi:macro domain-containing protein [Natronosporangium hydrolyticum]|uniref:Macro domain-containing protein n=1 Tax=Natronosporangium hydrolyticum TaxID=2811111 RepID=A0A895YKV9_9ACTN|nr:macro domain-containing protein [Natronosporangium hydrolyticum]QSB14488.1 macro domain-containing protein [Natronosporangium hydrolyticum]
MIEESRGNLLTAEVDALINTVNTVGVMGKGIALQFKRAYPENYRAYRAACERQEVRLGRMFVFDRGILGARRYIVNFPTKSHWRSPARMDDIRSGLADLIEVVQHYEIRSLAIPALGCGNGGLDWGAVRPLIEAACAAMPQVRTVVFPPDGAPPAEAMPDATPRPRLTRLRSLLLATIADYLERARLQEYREGVSELEVQKLAYFLQLLGAPLNLHFVRGRYGPYSDRLGKVLETLEGHYLTGLGDRSARVSELAPITPLPGAVEAATASLHEHREDEARRAAVLDLINGFETPYSLELLATVHFAAIQLPLSADPDVLSDRVAAWSLRKARLFTDAHVQLAAGRLGSHGLLPT